MALTKVSPNMISGQQLFVIYGANPTAPTSLTSTPATVKWGTPNYNTLTGYNTSTGVFTAPVAGLAKYTFRCLADMSSSVHTMYLQPRVNGSVVDNILDINPTKTRTGIMASGVINLAAGDTLDFQLSISSNTGTYTPSCSGFSLEFEPT